MQRQRIILIIGIFLAVAAVMMTKVWMDQREKELGAQAERRAREAQANMVSVLVAQKDIARGAVVGPNDVTLKSFSSDAVQPQAVQSIGEALNMVALAPIGAGQQITRSILNTAQAARAGSGLAEMTPVGKRAVSVAVDNMNSLAGLLHPRDYVDVVVLMGLPVQGPDNKIVSEPVVLPLFQNVQVLSVGRDVGGAPVGAEGEAAKGAESPFVTLALTPQEGNMINFVQEQGKIRLTVRSPADATTEPIPPMQWQTLLQYAVPAAMQKAQKPETEAPVGNFIEIYRGLIKDKIELTQ